MPDINPYDANDLFAVTNTVGSMFKAVQNAGASHALAVIKDDEDRPEGGVIILADPALTLHVLNTIDAWEEQNG